MNRRTAPLTSNYERDTIRVGRENVSIAHPQHMKPKWLAVIPGGAPVFCQL